MTARYLINIHRNYRIINTHRSFIILNRYRNAIKAIYLKFNLKQLRLFISPNLSIRIYKIVNT